MKATIHRFFNYYWVQRILGLLMVFFVLMLGCENFWVKEEVWKDKNTGLQWQNPAMTDENDCSGHTSYYVDAKSYCENLKWAGHDDWRLPTIDELRTLIRRCTMTQPEGQCLVSSECLGEECFQWQCLGCEEKTSQSYFDCYWPDGLYGQCDMYWSASPIERDYPVLWKSGKGLKADGDQELAEQEEMLVEGEVDGDLDTEPDGDMDVGAELDSPAESELISEVENETKVESELEVSPEAEKETEEESAAESEQESDREPEVEAQVETEIEREPELEPDSPAELEADKETIAEREAEEEAEPEPELEPERELESPEVKGNWWVVDFRSGSVEGDEFGAVVRCVRGEMKH